MATGDEAREALSKFVQDEIRRMGNFSGIVKEITDDEEYCTLEPLDGGALYYKVKLKPVINGQPLGIIPIPEVGSVVWAGHLENRNDVFVLGCGRVSKYIINTPDGEIQLTANKHILNGDIEITGDTKANGKLVINNGVNGGMVKVAALVGKMNLMETKLTQLMADVALMWPQIPAFAGTTAPSIAPPIVNTTVLDLENEKVKH